MTNDNESRADYEARMRAERAAEDERRAAQIRASAVREPARANFRQAVLALLLDSDTAGVPTRLISPLRPASWTREEQTEELYMMRRDGLVSKIGARWRLPS